MAVYPQRPVPVPTPFQPISYGGNPFLSQTEKPVGEFVPKTATPQTNVKGVTTFNTGAIVPTQQIQTPPAGSVPNTPSGFDWGEYQRRGWNNYAAALADYQATGGPKTESPSPPPQAPPQPPPQSTYNLGGQNYTVPAGQEGATNLMNEIYGGQSDFGQYGEQFNWDPSKYLASIESEYGATNQALNTQENALRQAFNEFMGVLGKESKTAKGSALTSKQSAQNKIAQGRVTAEQSKQDALSAATRLFNELQTGYRQRFGGASSAGEAAQTILGGEQQRQAGMATRDFVNTNRQLDAQGLDIDRQYDDSIQQIESETSRAKADQNADFMQNLTAINNNRTLSIQAKEYAKRQLMLQQRQEAAAMEQNRQAMLQQITLMREQARIQLETQKQSLAQAAQRAGNIVGNIANNYAGKYSNITVPASYTPSKTTASANVLPSINNAVGYISPWGYEDKDRQQSVMY